MKAQVWASGFTRQRMITTAIQRSDQLRWVIIMSIYQDHHELFVFVDETGTDKRECLPIASEVNLLLSASL